MYGYAGKMLFVNLTDGTMEDRPLDERTARNFLGGPALGAKILYDNMPAHADPFGPESMVGFVTGPANNTGAMFGGRYTVVSKSPVTGGWNDSNSGGYFGPALKRAGYDAVFVNGISDRPVYLLIEEGKAQLCDADELWGMTASQLEEALRARCGDKVHAAYIGPAGEHLSNMACVMNDGHRAAGRGGSGAVIGSKKLKAIVVLGDAKTELADPEAMREINKEVVATMNGPKKEVTQAWGEFGTGIGYVNSVLSGDAGVKNWSGSGVTDYPEAVAAPVGSQGMLPFKKRKYNCSNCPLGCGAILDVPSDKWDLSESPRPEYETQGAFGSLLLVGDPAAVTRCGNLCNEYGLDTISTGSTIAWAMECYNEGVLSKEELDGVELTWGDGDAAAALCEKIGQGEGVGAVLAMGSREAARRFGKGEEFLVTASGIEEPQHDSRRSPGLARTYKYDPTPGRHMKGGLGIRPLPADYDYQAGGEADKQGVIRTEINNAGGFCAFGPIVIGTLPAYRRSIAAATGFTYTDEEYQALGVRMYLMRHAFNLREGLTRKDFTLSKRYTQAPPPVDGPNKDADVDVERLADAFFDAMQIDRETLKPARELLEALGGLEDVVSDLYGA